MYRFTTRAPVAVDGFFGPAWKTAVPLMRQLAFALSSVLSIL